MALIDIDFAPFSPDLPSLNNSGLVVAHNCTAGQGSAQGGITLFPLKSAAVFSDTSMGEMPLGSAVGQSSAGDARVYGGSATTLWKLAPGTRQWTDVSRSAHYTTAGSERWKAIEFGNLQIFTNYNDAPQYISMDADVQFADLTSLVKGRHIASHKGFVILGNTYDALDGAKPNRIRWSAIENPADFNYSPATQSDFQDVFSFGDVQAIVTDDSCYVLLERGIVQMQYIGAPYVFQFTDRITGTGCSIPQSVTTVQGRHFFLSESGFFCLEQGQLRPIGMGKVDKWFLQNFDASQAHLMTVASDPRDTLIFWNFVSKNATTGVPDMMLIYNYSTGMWSTADSGPAHFVFNSVSLPWTIDMLDEFGSIDNIPASPDSPAWSGGEQMLWSMDAHGKIYSFSGPTLDLRIETPEFQLSRLVDREGQADTATVSAARPLFEGSGVGRIQVGTRKTQNADMQWSMLTEAQPETGFAYVRSLDRYHRFRVVISGDWRRAYALQVDAKPAGRR